MEVGFEERGAEMLNQLSVMMEPLGPELSVELTLVVESLAELWHAQAGHRWRSSLLRCATGAMQKLMHRGLANTEAAEQLTPGLRMLATVRLTVQGSKGLGCRRCCRGGASSCRARTDSTGVDKTVWLSGVRRVPKGAG